MGRFDWDNLAQNIQEDAFSDKKTGYQEDTRFYKLSRDKNDNGGALIRFVPGPDNMPFVKMIRINADKGHNNRFCKDWSPQSIGNPDPFNEMFVKLWKEGKKEEAKKFGRQERYIANIKVLKDPTNPDNEGKFFLLDMSKSLFDKIDKAINPSEDEMAIDPDLKPKNVFNPLKGHSMLLKIKRGSNGFLTYEDSKFSDKEDAIYKSEEEAIKDIDENAHSVSEFIKPENFKTYDELKECLNWFMGKDTTPSETEETKEVEDTVEETVEDTVEETVEETVEKEKTTKKTEKKETSEIDEDLDSLLDEL